MLNRLKSFLKNKNNRVINLALLILLLSQVGALGKMFFWPMPGFMFSMGESALNWFIFSMFLGSLGFVSNYGEKENNRIDIFEKIFGQWSLPDWMQEICKLILIAPSTCFSFLKEHLGTPKKFFQKISAIILVGFILFGMWWIENNKPVVIASKDNVVKGPSPLEVTFGAPSETSYEVKNGVLKTYIHDVSIYFDDSLVTAEQVGKEPSGGIRISPMIKGKWSWSSSKRLIFSPSENWRVGQEYTVDIGKELVPLSRKISSRRFKFSIRSLEGKVGSLNFYEDPTNPKLKKIIGEVRFNHPINYESLKSKIQMYVLYKKPVIEKGKTIKYQDEKVAVDFDVVKDPSSLKGYIHSKAIEIKSYSGNGFLKLSPGVVTQEGAFASTNEGQSSVPVPSVYEYFHFNRPSISIVDNQQGFPEHVLMIKSSTPVSAKELQSHLKIYQLKYRRGLHSLDDLKTTDFEVAKAITPDIIESQEEYPKRHSFKLKVKPNSKVYIELKEGIESLSGFKLEKFQRYLVNAPDYKKELKILQSGALLSRSGDKKISIMTRNVSEFKLKIGHVLPEQIHHLISQTNGSYSDPSFNNYNFGKKNLALFETKNYRVSGSGDYKAKYTVIDLRKYLEKYFKGIPARGLFFIEVRSLRGSESDKRLVNVTDLGILIKKATNGTRKVFVQSLKTGRPISGAKVEVIGLNGLSLISKNTNSDGVVDLPKLYFRDHNKRAIAFYVRKENDISYMKVDDYGRTVNFSRFDVGGISNYSRQGRLLAYVFNDRGTYRPGEMVNLGFIVKDDSWIKALDGIPLEIDVANPKGQIMRSRSVSLNQEGFLTEEFRLGRSAPTGTYSAKVYSIKNNRGRKQRSFIGSGTFSVQEFLPDTMKIKVEYSKARYDGWIDPSNLTAEVNLANLFGYPAAKRTIKSTLSINPYRVRFYKFKDYSFTDPSYVDKSYTENLDNVKTDAKGNAVLNLGLDKYEKGTFRIILTSEGFDAAEARSVLASNSTIVSPEKYMVGRKADGDTSYIQKDVKRTINFIAVDPKLKRISLSNTKLQLAKYDYVSVLTRQANGTYKYETVKKEKIVWKKEFSINEAGSDFILPSKEPGDFKLTLHDESDRVLNTMEFGIAGKRNLARNLEKDAELEIGLNKFDYMPGDSIEVEIKAPYKGTGLITIEREKVFAYKWFEASTETSVHKIRVPRDLEGNAYVNISFLRSSDSDKIYMSPYSFGVKPFTINSDKRKNPIEFKMPDLMKPGEDLVIKYKSKQNAKIVVYAVNEGILQLSKYKTPRPLKHFFKKRSLDVRTFQILDLLLPEFSILKKSFAEGGGYALGASSNLNPFGRKLRDPVAFWSKLLDSGPEWNEVRYRVPDYFNGSIRVMAVTVNEDSIGSHGQHLNVRGDIIIAPTVPTFISPGDEFFVSANLTNNIEDSGENASIKVQLEHSKNLKVVDGASRELKITERKDGLVRFKLKALSELGNASVTFKASGKGGSAKYNETMSVRPGTSFHTTAWMSRMEKGTQKFSLERKTFKELASKKLTISSLPFGLTDGIFNFLSKYPYGCTEQLVSKAFPYIVMKRRTDKKIHDQKINEFIAGALDMLVSRQNYSGGFGLYPGLEPQRDFISLYAFHFLLEAREEGFRVPEQLFSRSKKFIQNIARDSSHLHEKAYAIYLLTRSGVVTTAFLSSFEKKLEEQSTKVTYQKDLGTAYIASSYMLLKQETKALSLIKGMSLGDEGSSYYRYYSELQRDGGFLYLISKHFPEIASKIEPVKLDKMMVAVKNKTYTSLSSSFLFLGLDAYSRLFSKVDLEDIKIKAHYLTNGKKTAEYLKLDSEIIKDLDLRLNLTDLEVEYSGKDPIYISLSHAGFDQSNKESEVQSGMIIEKTLTDLNGNRIENLKIGEEGIVELSIRSKAGRYEDIAIVDLLPGGFDLVVDNTSSGSGNSLNIAVDGTDLRSDYIDAREDRIILYSSISTTKRKFLYKVKAISEGAFNFPGTFSEGMYNPEVKFVGKEFDVSVEKAN